MHTNVCTSPIPALKRKLITFHTHQLLDKLRPQSECSEQFDGLCSCQGWCRTERAGPMIDVLCGLATFHAKCDGHYIQVVRDAKNHVHVHKIDMDGGHPLDDDRLSPKQ